MIQRIQTLFLLFSIATCIGLSFLPLGHFRNAEENILTLFSIQDSAGAILHQNWLLIGCLLLLIGIQLAAIVSFGNRIRQIMLARLSLVVLVALVVLILLYGDIFQLFIQGQSIPEIIDFSWTLSLFVLPWILTFLAIRNIRKDEALVRSADRLR